MRVGSWILVTVVLSAAAVGAACGGGPGANSPQGSPSASASAVDSASASASASAPAAVGHMKPPVPSTMATDLTAIGLDPKNLPPMAKLEPDKLRKVMKLLSKSLGVPCNGCHLDDMSAATPRKAVTEHMWDEYARGMTMADGSPLFCDSCHQSAVTILDRSDKKVLAKWMDGAYVAKLKPKAKGASIECATCHGEDHEMHFIDLWKAGKKLR